jgi:glycosyltransferase 2 family protein
MPDRPAASAAVPAAPADSGVTAAAPASGPGDGAAAPRGGLRARGAAAARVLTSRPFRYGFVAVVVALCGYAVVRRWPDVRAGLASLGFLSVAGAMVSVLLALLATMQVWRVLIGALGSPLPVRASARVMFIGQLGKYLPGSVWPVLAQMELGTAHRVPRHRSASSSVLTMLLTLLAGLLVALVTLPFVSGSTSYWWVFLVAPVLLVCLYPKLLNGVLNRMLRAAGRPPLEHPLAGRAIAAALAWALVTWACYGLQIWLLVIRLGAPYGTGALLATGGFAFAWCVGFLVVFAPAGAGVRDVVLVAILSPTLGVGNATAVALVSRAVLTVADLVTAAAAAGFGRRSGVPAP